MKFRNPFKRKEIRQQTLEEALISSGALLGDTISKEQAMNIPSVSACVDLIANTIASLPIQLFKEVDNRVEIVKDYRVALLNDNTQDTLDGVQFKRAMIEDYLLQGSGYAYIKWARNKIRSLHFVSNPSVGVNAVTDPIFKKYDIQVNGQPYRDWEFLKLTRKSKDGITGRGIIRENGKILSVIYNALIYEELLTKTGGGKKGFLKSQGRLSSEAITELKNAWNNLYKANSDNVVILNNGLEFQEASNTSVEMQLSEHKITNNAEVCKLFLVPPRVLNGEASYEEYNNFIKMCILPILTAFECAMNKDLLLPSEQESFFFAFDTNELMKADIKTRFEAYEIGTKNGILQIDEVRFKENLPPLGLPFIKLGLQDVLLNPSNGDIYTPNTNQTNNMSNPTNNVSEVEGNGKDGNQGNPIDTI